MSLIELEVIRVSADEVFNVAINISESQNKPFCEVGGLVEEHFAEIHDYKLDDADFESDILHNTKIILFDLTKVIEHLQEFSDDPCYMYWYEDMQTVNYRNKIAGLFPYAYVISHQDKFSTESLRSWLDALFTCDRSYNRTTMEERMVRLFVSNVENID